MRQVTGERRAGGLENTGSSIAADLSAGSNPARLRPPHHTYGAQRTRHDNTVRACTRIGEAQPRHPVEKTHLHSRWQSARRLAARPPRRWGRLTLPTAA